MRAHAAALDRLVGHTGPKSILRTMIDRQRIPTALVFAGPAGVGKFTAATLFAEDALRRSGEPDHTLHTRLCARSHPDVRCFGPPEGNSHITAEFVRQEVREYARFAPFEGHRAFLLFPDADVSLPAHHPQSANALLKAIEEPKPNVHFIFVTHRPHALLGTMLSRCQRIPFGPLSDQELSSLLPTDLAEVPVEQCRGSLATAHTLQRMDPATRSLADQMESALMGQGPAPVDLASTLAKHPLRDPVLERVARRLAVWARRAPNVADAQRVADLVLRMDLVLDRLHRTNSNPELTIEALLHS